jgi:hypothetical protein
LGEVRLTKLPKPFKSLSITDQSIYKMHLAYSALKSENNNRHNQPEQNTTEVTLRYFAYLETCERYKEQIAAVRKYFPGWMPQFR